MSSTVIQIIDGGGGTFYVLFPALLKGVRIKKINTKIAVRFKMNESHWLPTKGIMCIIN